MRDLFFVFLGESTINLAVLAVVRYNRCGKKNLYAGADRDQIEGSKICMQVQTVIRLRKGKGTDNEQIGFAL